MVHKNSGGSAWQKRILCFLLAVSVLAGFSACSGGGGRTSQDSTSGQTDTLSEADTPPQASDILVAYFSATGTTEGAAQRIAAASGGRLYEITPAQPYSSADLSYTDDGCRANREQNDPDARPAINGKIENIEEYDVLFLGYPIWWGGLPKVVYTFLESYALDGKIIVPFCTSGGSDIDKSVGEIRALAPNADVKDGRRFSGSESDTDLSEWIKGLDMTVTMSKNTDVAKFNLASGKNGKAPTVRLNSGYEMPILGLGTYSLHGDTVKNSVTAALKHGVRLIDTAYMYGNEKEIGEAIRASDVPREEIFVITKIYPGEQFQDPEKAIQDALDKLDIGYIDMMLLHHPGENDVNAYLAMEKFAEAGKIRSLGLSNWYIEEIDDFIAQVNIKPALVQNEIHPYYQEREVVPYMQNLGIVMQAWYPLGGRGHTGELLNDETITAIAEAHGVSSAQVILRWHLQRGVVAIPGSSNPEHILENISVFDFALSDQEMDRIAALDRNEKHDWY